MRFALGTLLAVLTITSVQAGVSVDELRREVEDLRKRLNQQATTKAPAIGRVDQLTQNKFGPNAAVTTKTGKLEIGGLLQLWNVSPRGKDTKDVFGFTDDRPAGTNEHINNGGYFLRRTELRFGMDVHENIHAYVAIDPARQQDSIIRAPSNQGLFKSRRFLSPEFAQVNDVGGSTAEVAAVQTGSGTGNRLLLDAYINYHGVVPHHDFTIGQFKPKFGEEGPRDSGNLDFGERAMITQINDERDLGLQVHGTWWDDRFQYWTGVFGGAGNFFGTAGPNTIGLGQFGNRSDDNDHKDFLISALVRPIWNCGPWGSLELGYSGQFGVHGESANDNPVDDALNGLNRDETSAIRHAAWAYYKPMGPTKGFWLRGEYGYHKDRTVPLSVNAFGLGGGPNGEQTSPKPFSREGFYVGAGYRLSESIFAEKLEGGSDNRYLGLVKRVLRPLEIVVRYEEFANIITEDLAKPDTHTDKFRTQVLTVGANAYEAGYRHRVSYLYMFVNEQEDETNQPARRLREVKNNVWMVSYQLMF
ncbi:MAG TPA: porin [Planctomycetota bacterium]|nr:porin [Planctomycetota bacterium]